MVLERRVLADARVVDEHVDAAELLLHLRDRRLDGLLARDVAGHRQAADTKGPALVGDPLEALHAASEDGDVSALLGEGVREGDAEARGGARDEGDAAVEVEVEHFVLLSLG